MGKFKVVRCGESDKRKLGELGWFYRGWPRGNVPVNLRPAVA